MYLLSVNIINRLILSISYHCFSYSELANPVKVGCSGVAFLQLGSNYFYASLPKVVVRLHARVLDLSLHRRGNIGKSVELFQAVVSSIKESLKLSRNKYKQ